MRFDEQRVVVTGAGSGIGQATAVLLRDRGADVVATDLRGAALAAAAEAGAETLAADVSTAAGRAADRRGGGTADRPRQLRGPDDLRAARRDRRGDLGRRVRRQRQGPVLPLPGLVPRLPAGGSVVNLSSVAAKYSQTPEAAIYSASKAAVQSITRTFAAVHGPRGVRVNSVCPGIIDTPMQDLVIGKAAAARGMDAAELRQARLGLVPMRREGEAEECARAIAALLSDELSYVTGQTINVCGGFQMY
jgi:NAD(P)-dependent dehydrogenase (short-subunit alcohol dehydrogenase family)